MKRYSDKYITESISISDRTKDICVFFRSVDRSGNPCIAKDEIEIFEKRKRKPIRTGVVHYRFMKENILENSELLFVSFSQEIGG